MIYLKIKEIGLDSGLVQFDFGLYLRFTSLLLELDIMLIGTPLFSGKTGALMVTCKEKTWYYFYPTQPSYLVLPQIVLSYYNEVLHKLQCK